MSKADPLEGDQGVPRFDRVRGTSGPVSGGTPSFSMRNGGCRPGGLRRNDTSGQGVGVPPHVPEVGGQVIVLKTPWWGSEGSPDLNG